MLYLVYPDTTMGALRLTSLDLLEFVREYPIDLAPLHWEATERVADNVIVQLALRHGVPCGAGIVIDGDLVHIAERPKALRSCREFAQKVLLGAQALGTNEFMEQVYPGWTEHGRELGQCLEEAVAEALANAERDLADKLDVADPDPQLVDHWLWLNGPYSLAV